MTQRGTFHFSRSILFGVTLHVAWYYFFSVNIFCLSVCWTKFSTSIMFYTFGYKTVLELWYYEEGESCNFCWLIVLLSVFQKRQQRLTIINFICTNRHFTLRFIFRRGPDCDMQFFHFSSTLKILWYCLKFYCLLFQFYMDHTTF